MFRVFIAVILSLFVIPGLGQLYNKEKKKAFIIIGSLLFIIIVLVYYLTQAIAPLLPEDPSDLSIKEAQGIVKDFQEKNPKPFLYYNLILLVLWLYSAIDAGFGAYRKLKKTAAGVAAPPEAHANDQK